MPIARVDTDRAQPLTLGPILASGAKDQRWGVNFERVIKRKNEFAYWAGWDRSYAFYHVSQAGHLAGLSEIRQVERMRRPLRMKQHPVTLRSFNGRKVGANATMDIGDFYRGTKRSVDLGGEVRPNNNISLNASYGFNKVDLPEGPLRVG